MFKNILKFAGLMLLMYALTFIPFGIYLNVVITFAAYWSLAKSL